MDIVLCMAADTLLRQALPLLPRMASHARCGPMLPGQRKAGLRMIEGQRLFPVEHRMAALTISTQPSQMRVLLGVAGRADRGGSAKLVAITMTSSAGCFGMAAH